MVQNQTVCHTIGAVQAKKKPKPHKKDKKERKTLEKMPPENIPPSACAECNLEGNAQVPISKGNVENEEQKRESRIISLAQYMKMKRIEDRIAKERKAAEDRDRFMKETAERKAAERDAVIKMAKKLILYRKPMCRRINQGLFISECYRELDAQVKFQETYKCADEEAETHFVNLMREDVAKYEEEMKEKKKKQAEIRQNYITDLCKQIEENKTATMTREREEFEAEKEDQMNMKKRLEEIKEYEEKQLSKKKEKLRQLFKDAIEEKKKYDLKLQYEEEIKDKADQIYRNAKLRLQKMQKSAEQKEKEEKERKSQLIAEKFRTFMVSTKEFEENIRKKAIEEQEAHYQEKERNKKERVEKMRATIHENLEKVKADKAKQLEEENDYKTWEKIQRFKKVECDKEWEAGERKRVWMEKAEYAKVLLKDKDEKETRDNLEKLDMEEAAKLDREIVEKENQKVLQYAEEVIKESEGVRPLYPILKALEDCKKTIGLIQPTRKGEVIVPKPKRRRELPLKCTKFVPEEKILYL